MAIDRKMQMIHWGLIGTGDVADRKGGPALDQDRSKLVAVTNRSLERAQRFANRHGGPVVYRTTAELLADPQIDAVYIATPPSSHAELTVQAAVAGKHVLCEKPMATTVADGRRMIDACASNDVALTIAFYRRTFPVVEKLQSLLKSGAIGKPLSIEAQTFSGFSSSVTDPWRLDASISGGGFLADVGSHRFDLFVSLFGAPEGVAGFAERQLISEAVDDASVVTMRFPGGILGQARFHWNTPIARDTLTIVGSAGLLSIQNLSDRGELTLETPAGKQHWKLSASAPVHAGLVKRMVSHLLDDDANPCPGHEALVTTQMISQIL